MKKFFWRGFQLCLVVLCSTYATPLLACDCSDTNNASPEVVAPIDYTALTISELYPDPAEGGEEFIEIYNTGEEALDLSQLMVRDAAGHTFAVENGPRLAAGEYLALSQSTTGISLNNTGDTIELLDSSDTVVCITTYDGSEESLSWNSIADEWLWSTPTPGAKNVAPTNEDADTENTNSSASVEAATDVDVATQSDDNPSGIDAPSPTTSATIILSELLPNPETSDTTDEWIEIQNIGNKSVLLVGWQLTDTVTTFTLPEVLLAPEEHAVFSIEDTHIALNNTGDTVYLIDGFGAILQGTTFDAAPVGESWSFLDGAWEWNVPTQNNDNAIAKKSSTNDSSVAEKKDANITSPEEALESILTISNFRNQDLGATGIITGIVTVEPGVFGDQYFYIQDNHAGIQVYAYNKQFPELSTGDRIQVTGILSSTRNEARIKISSAQDIVILSHDQAPQSIESEEINESLEGMLVSIEGSIASSTSTHIILASGVDVTIKSGTDINGNSFEDETNVTVVGIVSQYDDTYRILPRTIEDIVVDVLATETNGVIPAAHAATSNTYSLRNDGQARAETSPFPWSIFLLGGSLVVCVGLSWKRLVGFAKRLISPHSVSQHIQSPLPPVQHLSWAEAQEIHSANTQGSDHSKDSKLF